MHFKFSDVLLMYYHQPQHALAIHVATFGVILFENKNTTVIKICLNQSTVVKAINFWSKFNVE